MEVFFKDPSKKKAARRRPSKEKDCYYDELGDRKTEQRRLTGDDMEGYQTKVKKSKSSRAS